MLAWYFRDDDFSGIYTVPETVTPAGRKFHMGTRCSDQQGVSTPDTSGYVIDNGSVGVWAVSPLGMAPGTYRIKLIARNGGTCRLRVLRPTNPNGLEWQSRPLMEEDFSANAAPHEVVISTNQLGWLGEAAQGIGLSISRKSGEPRLTRATVERWHVPLFAASFEGYEPDQVDECGHSAFDEWELDDLALPAERKFVKGERCSDQVEIPALDGGSAMLAAFSGQSKTITKDEWTVPADGDYILNVVVAAPTFGAQTIFFQLTNTITSQTETFNAFASSNQRNEHSFILENLEADTPYTLSFWRSSSGSAAYVMRVRVTAGGAS